MKKGLVILFATAAMLNAACRVEMSTPVVVEWTAYKTPKKVGVNGGFLSTVYHGKSEADDLAKLLLKSKVMLEVNNVDTKDPYRDAKLVQFFFSMMQGQVIEADVVSLTGDDTAGELVVNIYMNHRSIDVPLHYEVKEGHFHARGVLNLLDFKAQEALKMLTLNCYAPHEGKTWEDVAVGFSFDLTKRCDK